MPAQNQLRWYEPLFSSVRMRDKRGWMLRGLLIGAIFVAMLLGCYLDQRYGKGTISSCGGAIGFLLYAKTREWSWAWLPGLLAGFGGFYLHIAYTVWFEKQEMWNMESVFIALLGAAPGILMYAAVSRILRPKEMET